MICSVSSNTFYVIRLIKFEAMFSEYSSLDLRIFLKNVLFTLTSFFMIDLLKTSHNVYMFFIINHMMHDKSLSQVPRCPELSLYKTEQFSK
jgi:hypothetical protein